jgi:exopolysaccharide production protein ExoZ
MLSSPRPEPNNTGFLDSVQFLRGFAAFLVVLFHSNAIIRLYGDGSEFTQVFRHGDAGVDIFFILSGFIMAYITRGYQRGDLRQARDFLARRLERVLIPYWIYTTIVLLMFALAPQISRGDMPDIVKSYLLIPDNVNFLLMVGWTLSHELFFYFLFGLTLLLCPSRRFEVPVIAGLVVALTLAGVVLAPEDPVWAMMTSPLTLEFAAGVLLGHWFLARRVASRTRAVLLTGVGISAFILMNYGFEGDFHTLHRVVRFGIPALLVVWGLLSADWHRGIALSWGVAVGNASYSLYLSHWLILQAIGVSWKWAGFANDGLLVATGVTLCVAWALLTANLVERHFVNTVKMLASRVVPAASRPARRPAS